MRWSRAFVHTLRQDPADAEVASHRLMARAAMITKLAAGIYTYLPLGWRSVRKLEAIVRQEMDRAGSTELAMPAVHPAELWQETGRWGKYGPLLLRMEDRNGREFCFGPTHEEVVTDAVRRSVSSYRQLPVSLYQIQTKFRDEIRPRFGLMRGREFIMKDAYSFHTGEEDLDRAYRAFSEAYSRVFERCGLRYTRVDADSGDIGGSASEEFMVLADTGEDAILSCTACSYGANVEKAATGALPSAPPWSREEVARPQTVDTPGATSVEDVAEMLALDPAHFVKTMVFVADDEPVVVLIRGDREVNETKLGNTLGADRLELADPDTIRSVTGGEPGFSGPVGLTDVRVISDRSVTALTMAATGANAADRHLVGVVPGRDFEPELVVDLDTARTGDPCPRCGGTLGETRGIEVGHIFKLGTKYSEPMGCTFSDDAGQEHPATMGCYGLGIGRTVAAAVEQNHDDDGIVWPLPLAPFEVVLVSLNPDVHEVAEAADGLYDALREAGVDVLYDDRPERPGVKFKDADLIGFPVRVVVGKRGLADGTVELSLRRDREKVHVPLAAAVAEVLSARERLIGELPPPPAADA